MRNSKLLPILNFVFIGINLSSIVLLDKHKIYGKSIYETFAENWTFLFPDQRTFTIWLILCVFLIILHGAYLFQLNREIDLSSKIQNVGLHILLNQFLLGISMVLKLNDYIGISLVFSILSLLSLLKINNKMAIYKLSHSSILNYITKMVFGLYTGWFIYVVLFNGAFYFYSLFSPTVDIRAIISSATLSLIYGIIAFYTLKYNISALIFGYSIGILGAYFFIQESFEVPYSYTISIYYRVLISISMLIIFYNFYQSSKIKNKD